MNYSVQQIKFECFSYIKEFGARMEDWVIGAASDPDSSLFGELALDRTDDIWMWKPALSPAAARAVIEFMTSRYRLERAWPTIGDTPARFVFMYRKRTVNA
ncbi:MAG: hypothetical protein JWR14_1672 [Caballeronia sp.]|jgi:hypothetical protein|uniref:hypothetical protein n=1 Tax=Caballeronia sp. TaxID=1931223 RepID=UPI002609FA5A|nr:hypothetical protein [Caballeronia sp.]MDB5831842.1 hypothetical protein [Caballeronia sp.]